MKAHIPRHRRHHPTNCSTFGAEVDSWEHTIEALAMTLCPVDEWRRYEQQLQHLTWKANACQNRVVVRVFPVWRKYRQQAVQVATLYHAVPWLRHLPLRLVGFLGTLLIR